MATIGPKILVLCAIAVLLSGCAARKLLTRGPGEKFYAVTAEKTAFFRYGPQQANGADMELPKDSLMKLIRPSFGYSKVHLMSGEEGYVASEDIQPASPALVAAVTSPPPAPAATQLGEQFDFDSADPRLVVPPEELPESNPEPTPIPGTSPN